MATPVLPFDAPRPLDEELLAWAAGFFDGEGTTVARTDQSRGTYRRLIVTASQLGRPRVPAALVKFQRAMLGVGSITSERDGLYRWRAHGRIGAEVALALMWPWLGPVKRAQAGEALCAVARQYTDGTVASRAARYRPDYVAHDTRSIRDERQTERAWAAGFLDAEGCWGVIRGRPRSDGTAGLRIRVSASQHGVPGMPPEVLVRLRRVIGLGRIERHGDVDDFKWVAEGAVDVRRALDLVSPWLGEVKVAQAVASLDAHERLRVRGGADRCARGHPYDYVYVRPSGGIHRRCRACAALRGGRSASM